MLGGRPVELHVKDNRSVPARGIANLKAFAAMPDLVAVFGGRFSPVQLQQVGPANEMKVPLLDVWAAADGISDNTSDPNFVFRLSLKDSWAMPAMLEFAMKRGHRKIGVLLPNNGWGRSSQSALDTAVLGKQNVEIMPPQWYNWGDEDMLAYYERLLSVDADVILFVANDSEGGLLVRQLGERPDVKRLPIISHWGVTGGKFVEKSGPVLEKIDFTFVQTFSFSKAQPAALGKFMALAKAVAGYDDPHRIESPVGVAHAYDMMHILAKAVDLAGTTDRGAVRDALERVPSYRGLVRDYAPPFTPGRHDALTPEQVFMARFKADGEIVPVDR